MRILSDVLTLRYVKNFCEYTTFSDISTEKKARTAKNLGKKDNFLQTKGKNDGQARDFFLHGHQEPGKDWPQHPRVHPAPRRIHQENPRRERWCYEQVCLAGMFKLPKMLLANLLIARVMCRFYSRI